MKKLIFLSAILFSLMAFGAGNPSTPIHKPTSRVAQDSIGIAIHSDTTTYYRSRVYSVSLTDTTTTYGYKVVHSHPHNNVQSITAPKSYTQKQVDSVFFSKQ